MDISEIKTAYGAYYEKSTANKDRILALLTQGAVTPTFCTQVKTDDTVFKLGRIIMGDLVQAFQKGWTPKNAASFKPNEIRLYKMKVDEDIDPDDIEATWLGFLGGDSQKKMEWPLIKYLMEHPEQGYLACINRDLETKEYGHGVFDEPTPGTAGITGKSMNGYIIQLQNGVNAETINSIDLGTLAKDTIFDQVELFVDGISEVYQNVAMNVHMSPKWAKHYHRDKRAQGFYQMASDADVKNTIDFSPQQVVALPSLTGSDVIFATPKANFLHLTKRAKNKNSLNIEESKRTVSLMCDWWEGIGFGMDAAVWTNLKKQKPPAGN